jgi:hypothetical protein
MAIPGPVVHQQLMDAYAETQSRLEADRATISDVRVQRDELSDNRADALVSLAEHYLPELTREAIQKTWGEVQPAVHSTLLQKEDHSRRLQEQLGQLSTSLRHHQQQLGENGQQLDEASKRLQSITGQVESRLRSDPKFVELSDRAAVAEAALERAEANLEEIDLDAARKIPDYNGSSLFRYLYDRGFGTPQYRQRGFSRRMDRLLAKYIGFQKAKSGYEFLKNTPEQMRKLIADDRQALDIVMDELERRRDGVAEELNLPASIRMAQSLTDERDRHLDALNQLHDQIHGIERELGELEDTRGPYYREAVDLFRQTLDKVDANNLNERAKATSDITDDQIVARLMGVELEMEQLDEAARGRREELNGQHEFLAGLGRIIQRFRAAQFDSSRSFFVGSLDILGELEQAKDFHEIDYLWKRIRQAQRWGDPGSNDSPASIISPMSRLLVDAMSGATDTAKESLARRAGDRRVQRDSQWGGDSSHSRH